MHTIRAVLLGPVLAFSLAPLQATDFKREVFNTSYQYDKYGTMPRDWMCPLRRLGSCVYLLRSAHTFIAERTFDVRRKPEYFNRIILGTIGGGAIVLFVNQVGTENGNVIQLSAAALGFLGGYSTDFLFNTIERVINAILPKVGLQSVRTAVPVAKPLFDTSASGLTLKELLERFEKAQGEDKELYKSLIEKLRERA
jgi:hypothetical protein